MASSTSPAVERRRLAFELRKLRTEAAKTIDQVARHLECSPGKISRIETGVVGAQLRDVRDLLDVYQVQGQRRNRLLELARQARRRGWWHGYAGVLPPESVRFFGLEDGAATIDEVSGGTLVPGLLQTEDYAHALIATATGDPATVRLRVEVRLRRQQLLTRPDPPVLAVVLHEAALVAQIGGRTTMAGQLDRLAEVAELPNVTVLVLPLSTGEHMAAGSSFTIFRFADPADPPIVHVEQLTSNVYRERPDEVAAYGAAFEAAKALALPPAESRSLILNRARILRTH